MSESADFVITGPRDVVTFLRTCGVTGAESAQFVLGLALREDDPLAHVICGAAVRSGSDADRPIDHRQVVDLADELLVGAVVLATVGAEPGPPCRRSVERFVTLRRACADEGVTLLDWVLVGAHHWWSMRERVIHEAA